MSLSRLSAWLLLSFPVLLLPQRGRCHAVPDSLARAVRAYSLSAGTAEARGWPVVALWPGGAVRWLLNGTNTQIRTDDTMQGALRAPHATLFYEATGGTAFPHVPSRTLFLAGEQTLHRAHLVRYWAYLLQYGYGLSAPSLWSYLLSPQMRPAPWDPHQANRWKTARAGVAAYREEPGAGCLVATGLRAGPDGTEAVATVYADYGTGRSYFRDLANFWAPVRTTVEVRRFLQVVSSYTLSRRDLPKSPAGQ